MVLVTVPSERWEFEFLEDSEVEIERFISGGTILGQEILNSLFDVHGTGTSVESWMH